MMRLVRPLVFTLVASMLGGCPPECDGTPLTIQNTSSMVIPGITPETTIHVGDIDPDSTAEYIRVLAADDSILVEKSVVGNGDVLGFTSGARRFELHVDRIEHHITSTDFAHLCLNELP